MYFPKTLQRFSTKQEDPIRLTGLCLDATLKLMTHSSFDMERDARAKKKVRTYINSNIPRELQYELVARAKGKWYGAKKMLRLLEMFEPNEIHKNDVDLIGGFRFLIKIHLAF